MDETILVPSPNWFNVSIVAASSDGWLIYGGPIQSVCVLEPLNSEYKGVIDGDQRFKAHVVRKVHKQKIVSVDINPEWPQKRNFLTGSVDGTVKEWNLEKDDNMWTIKYVHGHEAHYNNKEEVIGVGYTTSTVAITVGNFGNIVKWDLNTNVIKSYSTFMKSFKPTCMKCSPHIPMQVAIGTKQGVIFLLDLNGSGKLLYKVRGQDDEILQLSWCPQYTVMLKKTLDESKKRWSAMERMDRIRNEPETTVTETAPTETEIPTEKTVEEDLASAEEKKLPEDSFDDTLVVQEDDMFDIYKDHEADEFGHKKYEPEDIYVKVKDNSKEDDFLAECQKLKADIIKKKTESEQSMESLVNAMDKVNVDDGACSSKDMGKEQGSPHTHRHLLASIGKFGGVRIWSKTGKLVATCVVQTSTGKHSKTKSPIWPTLCWHSVDMLLIADGKSQMLLCNPLKIDCKNKLEWSVMHSLHKRGLYCIVSEAPRVQTEPCSDKYNIWSTAQDRLLIRYNPSNNTTIAKIATVGGFIYDVKQCPYDASKIAVCVGDGAIRIWQTHTTDEDESRISSGTVTTYWQNVQGKVLTAAWHPTKENLLAFSTAESRVGLIDTSSKSERPAKVLLPALSGGVYSLCWATGMHLYATGSGQLVRYSADKLDEAPESIPVIVEGEKWKVSTVVWDHRGLLLGSNHGAVALFDEQTMTPLAATFVYSNMIHMTEWHPQYTSSSENESPYKNLVATCSMDKQNEIVILELKDKEGGGLEWKTFETLTGHTEIVFKVSWSVHADGTLISMSKDGTARVWAVRHGCMSIFGGSAAALCGAVLALREAALSAGTDCCLRVWEPAHYPAHLYKPKEREITKKKKSNQKKDTKKEVRVEEAEETLENAALTCDVKTKTSKKFLFPVLFKQVNKHKLNGPRVMIQKYIEDNKQISHITDVLKGNVPHEYDTDYLKLFGSINDVNEVLDMELANHLELNNTEPYMMVLMFRGDVHTMIQFASQHDLLDPYLLSLAPCVSFKYWKDATQLYLSQIDRLVAKGDAEKLNETRSYGGCVYRKAITLLAVHDVTSAVNVLCEGKLYMDAYILCRLRHMDSIAEQTLHKWAAGSLNAGNHMISAICHLALGNVSQAATVLGRSNDQDYLNLAAELAKTVGHNTFADHVEKKAKDKSDKDKETEQILEDLPKRIELLLKEKEIGKENDSGVINSIEKPVNDGE